MANKLSEALLSPEGTGGVGVEWLQFLAESAYLWWFRGRHDKAVPMFEALTLLAPGDPVGYLGLAEIYLSQRKFREAEKAADQAARTSRIDRRTLAFAYSLKGRALIQLNRPRDAEKALRRAVEMDPKGDEGRAAMQMIELATRIGILTPAAEPATQK